MGLQRVFRALDALVASAHLPPFARRVRHARDSPHHASGGHAKNSDGSPMTAFNCSSTRPFFLIGYLASDRQWRQINAALLTTRVARAAPVARAQVGVSKSGPPGYGFPIAVPPGISGMAPNLALSFSGAGMNGTVGQGWSVQGISSGTRSAGFRASDRIIKGVGYSPRDKLCLDGQSLVQTNANGAPLATTPAANGALSRPASATPCPTAGPPSPRRRARLSTRRRLPARARLRHRPSKPNSPNSRARSEEVAHLLRSAQ